MFYKFVFVNIVGSLNVGKFILMNVLMKEKLFIVIFKVQIICYCIYGILNGDDYQIVFFDMLGVVNVFYKLYEVMMSYVEIFLKDVDVLLFIIDMYEFDMNYKEMLE